MCYTNYGDNMKKKIIKYILLFLFFVLILLLFGNNNTDNVWNYGVSHALRIGELPYKDYNSITTPLYQFIMSIGLFINDSYLTFIIEQAILCTIFCFILEKLVKDNFLFVLAILLFPIYYFFFANYNFLVMLLFILLLYLEKEKKKDSIIGIVLGLLVLSKHSVGGIILIFSLFATKDFKRSLKRLLYSLIPLTIFLIYLLITNTFINFLDLCVFGLFDFAQKNKYSSWLFIIITLTCFIYTIYSFKNKKDIINYYLLPSFTLLIPIMDLFHTGYLFGFFIIVLFMRKPLINKKIPKAIGITIIVMTCICNTLTSPFIRDMKFLSSGRMKYVLLNTEGHNYVENILNKYKTYDNAYIISMNSMYFDIESNKKITFFDIPLYGNFGYDGLNKMKRKIDNMHNTYFFVRYDTNRQFANELVKHIKDNSVYKENVENFEIYYKE